VRHGIVGFLLKSIAWISLIAGPIVLLVLFQLRFLPYHDEWITWWQRIAVVIDLILLWRLWPPIARGKTTFLAWHDLRRVKVTVWIPLSLLPILLVFTIATFPGEWLEDLPPVRLIPTTWAAWTLPSVQAIQTAGSGWATLHELLVAGGVNYVTGRPQSLWSNVLVLPNFEVGDRVKFDAEGKIVISSDALSLRGRSLEGAVLVFAHLRKADFTAASLARARFTGADLREAKFGFDWIDPWRETGILPRI
jgi:Pentapeptide repeats (8 copies)